jgi:hypothetical protein
MASSSSSSAPTGVRVPVYELAPAPILRAVEHASSLVNDCTDEAGEFYSLAMAEVLKLHEVPEGAVVVLPLSEPASNQPIDFSFLALSPLVFLQLYSKPQPRSTYGYVAGYSDGTTDRPLAMGAKVRFPSVDNYVVAKQDLLDLIQAASGEGVDSAGGSAKRVCMRQPEAGGELAGGAVEKVKGAYPLMMTDLDEVTYLTRNKTDLVQRERELYLILRMMDMAKREYVMTTDMVIQPEIYRSTLCEMSDSQPEDVHVAFTACSLISRMQGLAIFRDKTKMKLFLTGSVLLESATELSLNLDDFVTGHKISSKSSACPGSNIGMVGALDNMQMALQVVFSTEFTECFRAFIDKLHGVTRPMYLVPADLLRYSVEMTLRKFFRIVRSVKGSSLTDDLSLKSPRLCSEYLKVLFEKISESLSNYQTMQQHEAYFRFRAARRSETETPLKLGEKVVKVVTPTVRFESAEKGRSSGAPPSSTKPCAGHMGGLLRAVKRDGRPYKCEFGSRCSYQHISPFGKSNEKLLEYVESMSPVARADLGKVIRGAAWKKV